MAPLGKDEFLILFPIQKMNGASMLVSPDHKDLKKHLLTPYDIKN
jgi:hypothetical protein